jgi:hypothetical protein
MFQQRFSKRVFAYQLKLRHFILPTATGWFLSCLLILLGYGLLQPHIVLADDPLVTQEIRYYMPDAGEVILVWGINGWAAVPEEMRFAGTIEKDGAMNTPMIREGDTFVATIQVPANASIDYGFWISKMDSGDAVGIWEDRAHPLVVTGDGVVEVQTKFSLKQDLVTLIVDPAKPVTQEIRYQLAGADQVWLVWGIDGWILVPEAIRPAGTVVKNGLMYTPMVREGNTFVARVQAPAGEELGYRFLITKSDNGTTTEILDSNSDQGYRTKVVGGSTNTAYVMQKLRYFLPQAGEVFLVWGIDGWSVLPEAMRPVGTVVYDGRMYTPMSGEDDTFVTSVQVPAGATIDYAFFITKSRHGADLEILDNNDADDYHTVATDGGVTGHKGMIMLEQAEDSSILEAALYLLVGLLILTSLGLVIYVTPVDNRTVFVLVLVCLTLLGLILRLGLAWNTNQFLPDTPARLSASELSVDAWASSLHLDSWFQWQGRTPIYPLFLAAYYLVLGHSYAMVLYLQAVIGAMAIPLTYLLARRFTGIKLSLLAAALVALHPTLTAQVTRLSDEALFTVLLLLVWLALLWALDTRDWRRFMVAGVVLAVACLSRPTMVLLPVVLLFLLPRTCGFKRKVGLSLIYAGGVIAVVLFWSLHSYYNGGALVSLNGFGTSLWQGSPEFFHLMEENRPISEIRYWYLDPNQNGGYDPFTLAGDRHFTKRAIESILAEPGIFALYSFLKLPMFWIGHPAFDWPDYGVFNIEAMRPYFSVPAIAGIFAARLLPLVAVIGLVILHEVHGRVSYLVPLLVICGYLMLIHALTHPQLLYSEPLHPILVIIIVSAIRPEEHASARFPVTTRSQWRYT